MISFRFLRCGAIAPVLVVAVAVSILMGGASAPALHGAEPPPLPAKAPAKAPVSSAPQSPPAPTSSPAKTAAPVSPTRPATPVASADAPLAPLAHVEVRGSGPVDLVLVPGLSCDWRVFDAFMTRNEKLFRMFAVTLPGFGGSQAPPLASGATPLEQRWLANAEAAIVQLVRERKLTRPVIIGHSLGGNLALRLAIHHGNLFRSAISLDGLPFFPPPRIGQPDTADARAAEVMQLFEKLAGMTDAQWIDRQRQTIGYLVKDLNRAKELLEMCSAPPRATSAEYMCELMATDLRPELSRITIPTLTIGALSLDAGRGAMDTMRDVVRKEFASASPNVHLVFIEDSRHFVMDDHPGDIDRMVGEFIAGTVPSDVKWDPKVEPQPDVNPAFQPPPKTEAKPRSNGAK